MEGGRRKAEGGDIDNQRGVKVGFGIAVMDGNVPWVEAGGDSMEPTMFFTNDGIPDGMHVWSNFLENPMECVSNDVMGCGLVYLAAREEMVTSLVKICMVA